MGYIYLLKSDVNGYITYKIGKTSRLPKNRMEELSTGNAGNMEIVYSYETNNYSKLELILHNHYRRFHISKEWFNDDIDITDFKYWCKKWDDSISSLKDMGNPFI